MKERERGRGKKRGREREKERGKRDGDEKEGEAERGVHLFANSPGLSFVVAAKHESLFCVSFTKTLVHVLHFL